MNGLRVLLVDDDPTRLAQRVRGFERHGYEVLTAGDPHAAVAALRSGMVVDIAVIDLTGGAVSAVALINALRGLRSWLPAVIMGSKAAPDSAKLADPHVLTLWVPAGDRPLALSSAIMRAACPGREPDYCPFRGLIGSARDMPKEALTAIPVLAARSANARPRVSFRRIAA